MREYLVMSTLSAAPAASVANACESAGPATATDAVRAQRAAFNEAIAKKDIEAVAATMHENIILAAGVYAAKWRRVDGTWLLESELSATEGCGGDI